MAFSTLRLRLSQIAFVPVGLLLITYFVVRNLPPPEPAHPIRTDDQGHSGHGRAINAILERQRYPPSGLCRAAGGMRTCHVPKRRIGSFR